jgi:hypothetical protein
MGHAGLIKIDACHSDVSIVHHIPRRGGQEQSGKSAMSILGDLQAVAARLSLQDRRPICAFCGKGKLVLIDERPDPNFGALGVVEQTLRCDSADCGKITID